MNAGRQIQSVFQLAIAMTVGTASVILMLAEGSYLPVGLTPVLVIVALLFNLRRPLIVLPTLAANILGVTAIAAAAVELYLGNEEARILSGAHLIVYVTWIVLFMKKTSRQHWWLLALSVLQLAIACVLTRASLLGFALISMLFLMIWTLSLFTLHRLQLRAGTPETHENGTSAGGCHALVIYHGIQTDPDMNWIGSRFRLMILGFCMASLMMSGLAFAAFPRVFVGNPLFHGNQENESGLIQRTGFREEVRLGEFGTLIQSNERVLRISVFDQATDTRVPMDTFAFRMGMDELLLRGTTMGNYQNGEWTRGPGNTPVLSETQRRHFSRATASEQCYRVEITQEPPIGTFAFAPRPIIGAR